MVADGWRNTMPKSAQVWKQGKKAPLGPTRLEIHGNLPAGAPNMLSPYSCQRRLRKGLRLRLEPCSARDVPSTRSSTMRRQLV